MTFSVFRDGRPADPASGVTHQASGISKSNGDWDSGFGTDLDGSSSSYIDFPALSPTGNISVSYWANPDSIDSGTVNAIVSTYDGGVSDWFARGISDSNDELYIQMDGGSNNPQVHSGVVPSTNTWYHIVGIYDASTKNLSVYVNRNLKNSKIVSPGEADYTLGDGRIGKFNFGNPFEGTVDELSILDIMAIVSRLDRTDDQRTAVGTAPLGGDFKVLIFDRSQNSDA